MVCKQKSHIVPSLGSILLGSLNSIGCGLDFCNLAISIKQALKQASISDHNGAPMTLLLMVFAKPLAWLLVTILSQRV